MSGAVQAYSGDSLNFSDLNNIPMVNSSIIVSEYKGSNGVVYLINASASPSPEVQSLTRTGTRAYSGCPLGRPLFVVKSRQILVCNPALT